MILIKSMNVWDVSSTVCTLQGRIQGVWDTGTPVWAPKLGAEKIINE